jgi:transcriptional regulator with XRE-family HTH domain
MHHMNIHSKHDYPRGDFSFGCLSGHNGPMNIRTIRKSRQLNQTQLADLAKLTQSTISRAEAGDDGVTLGNFKSIAAALDVDLADLFASGRSAAEQSLIEAYRKMSPDRRKGWDDALGIVERARP